MMGIDTTDYDSLDMGEQKAWGELKQMFDAVPTEGLFTLFYGTASERDQLMDDLGLARESWWMLGVLRLDPHD